MTRRQLVLHLLREAGPRGVTTAELLQAGCGSRYGGRLFELREQGHVIEGERLREGSWRYRLVHDPELGRLLSEAEAPAKREQASPGSVPSQEGVRLAAAVQESQEGLFDTGEFAPRPSYRDAA